MIRIGQVGTFSVNGTVPEEEGELDGEVWKDGNEKKQGSQWFKPFV